MLKLALPKGSLERSTFELFDAADLSVRRSSERVYEGTIDDPRIESVSIIRPQEIPRYVEDGHFDLGISGQDWIAETGANVVELGPLAYAKATPRPIRIVLAMGLESGVDGPEQIPSGIRVTTEYVNLAERYFEERGLEAEVIRSYGSNEAKVPDIVDACVHNTETGSTLALNGLKIVDVLMESWTVLIANGAAMKDDIRRRGIEEVQLLLDGAIRARGRVMVKLNVPRPCLDEVLQLVPSMKAPTVSELAGGDAFAVETVVSKGEVNTLIPRLKAAGASDIVELPLSKIIP